VTFDLASVSYVSETEKIFTGLVKADSGLGFNSFAHEKAMNHQRFEVELIAKGWNRQQNQRMLRSQETNDSEKLLIAQGQGRTLPK
jgi:hypothetical protein